MEFQYIPKDALNIILEYYGRIKYKNGEYVNVLHKEDYRYNIIKPFITKKMEIMKKRESEFRFELMKEKYEKL